MRALRAQASAAARRVIATSAKTGEGIDVLWRAIDALVWLRVTAGAGRRFSGTGRSRAAAAARRTRPSPAGVTPRPHGRDAASLAISRPAAAASWSAVAIAVTSSARPAQSGGRAVVRAARCRREPSATSTSPSRQGRPKVSLTTTAEGPRAAREQRLAQPARRGVGIHRQQHRDVRRRRVREVDAGVGAHEAVARLADQHAVAAPHDARASRAGSPRCGAGPCRPPRRCARASADGSRRPARRGGPPAFDTIFWHTTSTPPRERDAGARARRAASSAARSSPGAMRGMPGSGEPQLDRGRCARGAHAGAAAASSAGARACAAPRRRREERGEVLGARRRRSRARGAAARRRRRRRARAASR